MSLAQYTRTAKKTGDVRRKINKAPPARLPVCHFFNFINTMVAPSSTQADFQNTAKLANATRLKASQQANHRESREVVDLDPNYQASRSHAEAQKNWYQPLPGLCVNDKKEAEDLCASGVVQLWVDSIDYLGDLSKHFQLKQLNDQPEQGDHIIALKKERDIRKLARTLQGLSGSREIKILPYEQLIFGAGTIVTRGTPLDTWYQLCKDSPLDLEEGLEIAGDILQAFRNSEVNSTQKNIELEALRRRCDVNSFDWNKYIADLEKDIHAAVDGKAGKLSIVERFKADLLAISNSNDDLERLVRINELASTYRMPAAEIRKALARTEQATLTPKAQSLDMCDFLSQEIEGTDYLIPGLLPRGETVLCAGLPKSGKTLLSIDAAFAVATGESKFLGETVSQGKVLIVSVDESPQSTKNKLLKRGFRASDGKNARVMTSWDISQMGELEKTLEDFRPDLVVIDSLTRITVGREISENSAEFAHVIYHLKELLGRYGASGILIHHANKSQDAVGISKIRGSTSIPAATWGTWQLDHIVQSTDENGKPIKGKPRFDPSDPRRIFTATCRDNQSFVQTIQFNPENHSYSITEEDHEAQQERKTQEELILGLLTHYDPKGLTGREIMEALGLGRAIYSTLDRMVSRRTVTQRQSKTDRRSMVYALPPKRDTHPPLPSLPLLTNFSETTVVETKTNSQQLVSNHLDNSQQSFVNNTLADDLNADVQSVSGDSQQLLSEGGGVCDFDTPELSHTAALPPIGSWVKIPSKGNKLAKVTKHLPMTKHLPTRAYVEGEGNILGVYSDVVPLTKEEMLKAGLRF